MRCVALVIGTNAPRRRRSESTSWPTDVTAVVTPRAVPDASPRREEPSRRPRRHMSKPWATVAAAAATATGAPAAIAAQWPIVMRRAGTASLTFCLSNAL